MPRPEPQKTAFIPSKFRWLDRDDHEHWKTCWLPECQKKLGAKKSGKRRLFCDDEHRKAFARRRLAITEQLERLLAMPEGGLTFDASRQAVTHTRWLLELRASYATAEDALSVVGAVAGSEGPKLINSDTRACPRCAGAGRILRVKTGEEKRGSQVREDPRVSQRRQVTRAVHYLAAISDLSPEQLALLQQIQDDQGLQHPDT